MFDFEGLEVYKKAKVLNKEIFAFIKDSSIDCCVRDQLRRASVSIVVNIAEGSGKFSKADKRNFYTISPGSTYECVSLFDILQEEGKIAQEKFKYFYQELEIISKMLFGLIGSQK